MTTLLLIAPGAIVGYFLFLRPALKAVPAFKEFYAEADGFWAKAWVLCGRSITLVWGFALQAIGQALQWIEPLGTMVGDPDIKQQVTDALQTNPKVLGYVLMGISVITIGARLRSIGKG